jgi:formyltetrahydrofolate-dependent phosphoribosylglycinamide formyltransferase
VLARIVVMISGEGTNLQAILDAQTKQELKTGQVVLVVSNRKAARGLERAQAAGIETLYFPLKPYTDGGKTRAEYDTDLAEKIRAYEPDLIVLAGWMHILSPAFLDHFPDRVINLHPALPGAFPGANAIQRAFEAYQAGQIKYSGCMVHYVVPEVDAGPVIQQIVVPILLEDTLEDFAQRMHLSEHFILIKALRQVIHNLRVQKERKTE